MFFLFSVVGFVFNYKIVKQFLRLNNVGGPMEAWEACFRNIGSSQEHLSQNPHEQGSLLWITAKNRDNACKVQCNT